MGQTENGLDRNGDSRKAGVGRAHTDERPGRTRPSERIEAAPGNGNRVGYGECSCCSRVSAGPRRHGDLAAGTQALGASHLLHPFPGRHAGRALHANWHLSRAARVLTQAIREV